MYETCLNIWKSQPPGARKVVRPIPGITRTTVHNLKFLSEDNLGLRKTFSKIAFKLLMASISWLGFRCTFSTIQSFLKMMSGDNWSMFKLSCNSKCSSICQKLNTNFSSHFLYLNRNNHSWFMCLCFYHIHFCHMVYIFETICF